MPDHDLFSLTRRLREALGALDKAVADLHHAQREAEAVLAEYERLAAKEQALISRIRFVTLTALSDRHPPVADPEEVRPMPEPRP